MFYFFSLEKKDYVSLYGDSPPLSSEYGDEWLPLGLRLLLCTLQQCCLVYKVDRRRGNAGNVIPRVDSQTGVYTRALYRNMSLSIPLECLPQNALRCLTSLCKCLGFPCMLVENRSPFLTRVSYSSKKDF